MPVTIDDLLLSEIETGNKQNEFCLLPGLVEAAGIEHSENSAKVPILRSFLLLVLQIVLQAKIFLLQFYQNVLLLFQQIRLAFPGKDDRKLY